MSLFSDVRKVFTDSIESRQSESLARDIETTMYNLSKANPELQLAVFEAFRKKHAELLSQKANWSKERQVELGRELRGSSEQMNRHHVNSSSDEAVSYGLWLAGAWLESGALKYERPYIAHLALEEMLSTVFGNELNP